MSNKEEGDKFRDKVREFLRSQGYKLEPEYEIEIGLDALKKIHCFDLGNEGILIECKKYSWAESGSNRSGMFATLNEAILIFNATPNNYRKLLFIWKSPRNSKRISETIAEYYISHYGHLITEDIEIWEFDDSAMTGYIKFGKNLKQVKLGGLWKGI